MVVIFNNGFSRARGAALLGTLAMAYLSKRTALFLIPLSAVCVPLLLSWKKGAGRAAAFSALGLAGIVTLVVLMASMPAGGLRWALFDRYFWGTFGAFFSAITAHDYFSYAYLELLVRYFQVLFESFWGVFGWMNVRLDDLWYWALGGLTLAAVSGVTLLLVSPQDSPESPVSRGRHIHIFLLVSILFALGPIIAQYSSQFIPSAVPQGRYLFPVVIPISVLMVLGLRRVIPSSVVRAFPFALVSLMFLFDTASLALYIVPFYYGQG